MAETVVYLKVDSKFYDDRIKRATEGMKAFEEQCRTSGKSLADADRKTVEYIRAMGDMATVAQKPKQQLRELTDSILALTQSYQKLTDVEKQGDVGRALAESIDKLKLRASDLQDTIGDLNEELRHMASDTSFTDGINLMTRTIGSCTAAIVAWTGDSKEMEVVLKDLAKIGATVAAVEQLTKAFQKQNLVLLKNPYVIAAAAVAGMAVAIGALIKKQQELSAVEQDLQDVQTKARDNAAKEVTRIQTLNSILNDNTRSLDDRKAALAEIQTIVPAYHGALTTEGTLINNNTDALTDYITNLQRAATAQAAFDRMVEINKQKLAKQTELGGATARRDAARASYQEYLGSSYTGNTGTAGVGGAAVGSTLATEAVIAQKAVDDIQSAIDGYDEELKELQKLINGADLASSSGVAKVTGTTKATKPAEVVYPSELGTGAPGLSMFEQLQQSIRIRLADQNFEVDQNSLTNLLSVAMQYGIDSLNPDFERVQYMMAEGFDIPEETWVKLQDEINAALGAMNIDPIKINVNTGSIEAATGDVKKLSTEWVGAAQAIAQFGSALQSVEDPTAKIAGIIAQAIASVVAGAGSAIAQAGNGSAGGPWGWVAFAISATATMISTIAAIKSATSNAPGFAEGGIVGGNSYSGDRIIARLNSGEGVLTQKGISNAANMAAALDAGGAGAAPSNPFVTGETIVLGINNFLGRSGQGEIVTTSMLRRAGVKL